MQQQLRNIATGLRGQKGKINVSKAHAQALGIPCQGAAVQHCRKDFVKRVDGLTDEAITEERGPSALEEENAGLRRKLAELENGKGGDDDTEEEQGGLQDLTIAQLTDLAKAEGVDIGKATLKADIIHEIEVAREGLA